MAAVSNHSKSLAEVLDRNLSPPDRQKNLNRFSAPNYELSIVPTEGIPAVRGDTASLPVRVHFDAKDGNSLDTAATASFVRRGGEWYFKNFDFMSWPVFLIIVLVLGILTGVGYAATVLILRNRLLKRTAWCQFSEDVHPVLLADSVLTGPLSRSGVDQCSI